MLYTLCIFHRLGTGVPSYSASTHGKTTSTWQRTSRPSQQYLIIRPSSNRDRVTRMRECYWQNGYCIVGSSVLFVGFMQRLKGKILMTFLTNTSIVGVYLALGCLEVRNAWLKKLHACFWTQWTLFQENWFVTKRWRSPSQKSTYLKV